MKRNGSYLGQYLPWLGLLLGVDALAALLLWLADARAFAATAGVIVLTTVFLFACVCRVRCAQKGGKRLLALFCPRTEHGTRTGTVPSACPARGAEHAPAR